MRSIALRWLAGALALTVAAAGGTALGQARVGLIELDEAIPGQPGPLDWMGGGKPTFREVVGGIDKAAKDSGLKGLVVRLKDTELNITQAEELGAAMARARAAGKKIHLYADMYGPAELLLGSFADEVLIQPGAPVMLPGLYMEELFLADTLAWIGVKAEMVQIGDYKGASEQMARNAPSKEWDQNINGLLDGLYSNLTTHLKKGRGMNDAALNKAMEQAWMADGADAVKTGLVTMELDLSTLDAHLAKAYSGEVTWASNLVQSHDMKMDMANPFAMFQMFSKQPNKKATGPTIAVLHLTGAIVDGESRSANPLLGGGDSIGSRSVRRVLEELRADENIKGVVVRIDSPGGSATASEVIWQGMRRLAEAKPVWSSIGSMAASGGYYIAVGTDKIYVNPSSIVGSIGVVGGKMNMKGLYEWGKVGVVARARGPRASMFSSVTPWGDAETKLVRDKMTQTYNQFTARVSAGRKGIDLSKAAEGRLFVAPKSIELKMADKVGGLHDAIADMASSLSLSTYDVMDFPGPKSFEELMEETFKQFASAPGGGSRGHAAELGREVLGERAWRQLAPQLNAFMQMRDEPILLVSPRAIMIR